MNQYEYNQIIDRKILAKAFDPRNPTTKTCFEIKSGDVVYTINVPCPSGLEERK